MYEQTTTNRPGQSTTFGPRRRITAAAITLAATSAIGLSMPAWAAGTTAASDGHTSVAQLRYPHNGGLQADARRKPPPHCFVGGDGLCLPHNGG